MVTVINLTPIEGLSRQEFRQICEANPDLLLERSAAGDLVIVSPVERRSDFTLDRR